MNDFINKAAVFLAIVTVFVITLNSLMSRDLEYLLTAYTIVGNLFLAIVVLMKDPKGQINRAFSGMVFFIAFWSLSVFLADNLTGHAAVLLWNKMIYFSTSLLMIYIPFFAYYFPGGAPRMPRYVRTLIFWPGVILSLISIFTDLIVRDIFFVSSGSGINYGPFFVFHTIFIVLALLYALAKLIVKYFKNGKSHKLQLGYLFLGILLGGVSTIITNVILPSLSVFQFSALGPVSSLFLVGFAAYAIVKTRLMDISVVISRTIAEFMTVFMLGIIYLAMVWVFMNYVSTSIDIIFLSLSIVYGVLVGQVYDRTRIFFQTTADKLFLRGRYDYYASLSEASSRVGANLSLQSILEVLYDTFHEVVEIENPRVFLPEYFTEADKTSSGYLIYDKKTFEPRIKDQRIPLDSPLVNELIASRRMIFDPQPIDAALVVPCLLEDRLIAIFALGHKLSEEAYTDEDLRLLEVLANQAAITFDHTRSYERIRSDMETMERQMERSQRLASIGTLTAGVTHEIRNPLTVIRAETERLANQERDKEYLKQYSDLVLKHVDRIAGIVQRMLGLAKVKSRREAEINLTELLDSTLELFVISNVTVQKDLNPLPLIKGDPEEMQEVFVNLIQNALEAMPHGGKLGLSAYTEEHRSVIEISDTGKGIPEELRERIFDPFYSTRHEGVGLGLSIAYRIVREHGGDIKVTSEIGKGSTFRLLF